MIHSDSEPDRLFVVFAASCMGMAVLPTSLMLPAFGDIRSDFGLGPQATEVSWVLTAFFVGLGAGGLLFGPFSDRVGRKPMLYVGLGLCAAAGLASAFAPSLGALIACRLVWGLAAAAPRSMALAMVRDSFSGDQTARTMSLVMAVLILVPVFAPGLGSLALQVVSWRTLLVVPALAAGVMAIWARMMPETLTVDRRRSVRPKALAEAFNAVVTDRQSAAFTIVVTLFFGLMTGFLGSIEVIVSEVFGQGRYFGLLFGLLATCSLAGALISARIVGRLGLPRLLRVSALYVVAVTASFAVVVTIVEAPLWLFLGAMALMLPGVAVVMPNSNTAAMAQVPHVAGMAAAIIGTVSTSLGAVLGSRIDAAFDGTVRPFAYGVVSCAAIAAAIVLCVEPRVPPVEQVVSGRQVLQPTDSRLRFQSRRRLLDEAPVREYDAASQQDTATQGAQVARITASPTAEHRTVLSHGLRPRMAAATVALSQAVYQETTLTYREAEAARMRIAHINGCLLCQDFRVADHLSDLVRRAGTDPAANLGEGRGDAPTEEFYREVERWRTSALFNARERLAIEYAERIAGAPRELPLDDEFWERIRAEYDDGEIVDLTYSITTWIATGRFVHVLGLDGSCPAPPSSDHDSVAL